MSLSTVFILAVIFIIVYSLVYSVYKAFKEIKEESEEIHFKKVDTWNCPKCNTDNSFNTNKCIECGYINKKSNPQSSYKYSAPVLKSKYSGTVSPPPKNYVAFDLETTGLDPKKCQIIEIGAVKVENSEVTEVFSELIKPKGKLTETITDITGITDEMLEDAPSINRVLPRFLEFIGDDVLVGHNVDFDSKFLSAACARFSLPFENKTIDTLKMSRTACSDSPNYKLGTLCSRYGIINDNAHRALSDAIATQKLFVILSSKTTVVLKSAEKVAPGKMYSTKLTDKTKAIKKLLKFSHDVIRNGGFSEQSVELLSNFIDNNSEFCDEYPFYKIKNALDNGAKNNEIYSILNHICNIEYFNDFGENFSVSGKSICFSGECRLGSFEELKKDFEKMGATVKSAVSSKVDYLIVGSYGSTDWAYGFYGLLILKAMELQDKGKNVKIVREADFVNALRQSNEEPQTIK